MRPSYSLVFVSSVVSLLSFCLDLKSDLNPSSNYSLRPGPNASTDSCPNPNPNLNLFLTLSLTLVYSYTRNGGGKSDKGKQSEAFSCSFLSLKLTLKLSTKLKPKLKPKMLKLNLTQGVVIA